MQNGAITPPRCLATCLSFSAFETTALGPRPGKEKSKSEEMWRSPGHEEPLRPAGRETFMCSIGNYGTYLEHLRMDLDDGSIKDEDYADLLRERMIRAITMFDAQEFGINSVKVGRRAQHAEKNNIKKVCDMGRASVRFLMERVEPDAAKTDLMVDYNAELSYIVQTHSTIIAEHTRSLVDSLRDDLERAARVLNRSEIAKDAGAATEPPGAHLVEMMERATFGSRRANLSGRERSQEHES